MWTAKYKQIDKSGLNPEIKVFVEFSDGVTTYEKDYAILPSELETSFPKTIQAQVSILESKDAVQKTDLDALIDTQIDVQSEIL